ncbi:hypothetical protein BXY66_3838 [Shimia isoporae]|uniref:PH (Pleckstrin Homology) domain-containing protein n=1 Tax=Shimia isoporae TaxID=647720 RepID=A0A4R1N0E4_9RHOB|nr:hypothetical protein [Shimia isoporae]TCK99336.1 hypothetical protein BXY66_3838 [Shimia isoporae]
MSRKDEARMAPKTELNMDETVLQSFTADRMTYIRSSAWLAAGAMAFGMIALWAMGNPHVWTGAVGGLAAIAVRTAYLMSEELAARWDLTNQRVLGPGTKAIRLGEIKELNTLGSVVQIVTHSGDKHLIKFQADPAKTIAAIQSSQAGGQT